MRKTVAVLTTAAALAALTAHSVSGAAGPKGPSGPRWGEPVLLTIDKYFGGYEPSITVDRFNNVFVTAHKQNHSLVVSPDSRSATKTRSQSWFWTSKDGKQFTDMPGLTPFNEQNGLFGVEGDLAVDDAGHLYFVDTNVTDNSVSRYKTTGNGQVAFEMSRPAGPFGEPVDDRPWIAAHGDGTVLYIGNNGDRNYPLGQTGDGEASGPGRYTAYMSYDRAETFDLTGFTFADSGWCRPAADHRKGSKDLYVLCTNDAPGGTQKPGGNGTIWAYSSHDDGASWTRARVAGYDSNDPNETYPWVGVGPNGWVYALYNETKTVDGVRGSTLKVFLSKDGGRTWSTSLVQHPAGVIRYSSLDVASDGTVGVAYYYRENGTKPWHVYAATAKPGKRFVPTKVSETPIASRSNGAPFGDFFQIAFGPDRKLNVVYTSMNTDLQAEGLNSDIYFVRQK